MNFLIILLMRFISITFSFSVIHPVVFLCWLQRNLVARAGQAAAGSLLYTSAVVETSLAYFPRMLQEKNSVRELMTEEHQVAKRDLEYRLKLAEDEQSERLKTVILALSLSLLLTKFLQLLNLAIFTTLSLFNLLAVPASHLLSLFLARQPSLKIRDRSFTYASPRLWNQLPNLFRQPQHSRLDSPPHPLINSSLSSSPLSSSITFSLFHSRLKTYLFNKSFPP